MNQGHDGTDLCVPLVKLSRILQKKSVIFVISDFQDDPQNLKKPLQVLRNRHDIIAVRLWDVREQELPDIGLIELEDEETGEQILVDTADAGFRMRFAEMVKSRNKKLSDVTKRLEIDLIEISTAQDWIKPILKFFKYEGETMNFENPLWFAALLLLPVVWYFYRESIKKKKALAIKFSNISLIKEAGMEKIKSKGSPFLFESTFDRSLLVSALADPHIPLKQTKEGVNVVMVMDVSGSMAANDYKPTRLEAAKVSAKILVDELNNKDNSGIVIFSSGATTSAYLSPFKDKVLEKLSGIKQTEGETALGDGLSLAVDMATSIPNKKKVIILMSDGVNNAGVISPDDAISFAKTNNIQVYTVGIGSNEKVILGYDWLGRPVVCRT